MADAPQQNFIYAYDLTASGDSYIVGYRHGGAASTSEPPFYKVADLQDGPDDNLSKLGDIVADKFSETPESSPKFTFDGAFVGSTADGQGFVGKFSSIFGDSILLFSNNGNIKNGTALTVSSVPFNIVCFVAGTLIRTAAKDVAVENLAIGDLVVTASGEHRPIRWLGRRSYAGRFANANPDLLPICFKAGSLADDVPMRDLWVSPKHAIFLDGVLVPAECLVNGVTVVKSTRVDQVDYHHVELDGHDVLLAEGAPTESFVDDGGREMFHNAREFAALYPGAECAEARYCAPRIESGYVLELIRKRIADRTNFVSETMVA